VGSVNCVKKKANSYKTQEGGYAMKRYNVYLYALIFLALTFTGCATVEIPERSRPATDVDTALFKAIDRAFDNVAVNSKVAIIHIQTPTSKLNELLLASLQFQLISQGYDVVDRIVLDRIRMEQGLDFDSPLDDRQAISLAKIVGADIAVNGEIVDKTTVNSVRLKAIDTGTTFLKGIAGITYKSGASPRSVYFNVFAGGGMEVSQYKYNPDINNNTFKPGSKLTAHGGVSFDIKLGETSLLLEPGIRGVQKQLKFTLGEENWEETYTYADIFAKLKYDIPIGGAFAIQPFVGYEAGVLLSAKANGDKVVNKDIKTNSNSLMHIVPIGIDFVVGNSFVFGGEFDYGFTDLWTEGSTITKVRTNSIMGKIGWKF